METLTTRLARRYTRNQAVLGSLLEQFHYVGLDNERARCERRPRRVKRGLVDVVGTAFHHLFGVATDSDVKKLNERMTRQETVIHKEMILNAVAFRAVENKFHVLARAMKRSTDLQNKLWQRSERSAALSRAIEYAEALALQLYCFQPNLAQKAGRGWVV